MRSLAIPAFLLLTLGAAPNKAEITVLSAAAVQAPVEALAASFAIETGHQVTFEFTTAGGVESRMKAGAMPDIVITSSERMAALTSDRSRLRPLGTVEVGVAVRRGAPRPDISTAEAFSASLRRAQSIAYGDPVAGATTGIHFARVLDRLGLAEEVRGRTVLAANGLDVMQRVHRGEVEIGITQISEILQVDAAVLVGPLPEALQLRTTYVAVAREPENAAAAALIARLVDERGRARFRAAGFR